MGDSVDDIEAPTLRRLDSILDREPFGYKVLWTALCDQVALPRFENVEQFLQNYFSRFPE